MQAVILAAGKGTRLQPLTNTTPKPLILIKNKPLIEHVLEALPKQINEIIVVVNYLREQLLNYLGSNWHGIPIRYVIQESLNGTAGAVFLLSPYLHDRFLVINSDDLYLKKDLERLTLHERSMLVYQTEQNLQASAQIKNNQFIGLGPGSRAVCGAYVLDKTIFEVSPVEIKTHQHNELGLPQTVALLTTEHPITAVFATSWMQVGTMEQLKKAQNPQTSLPETKSH
jgi:UDP-N-acetylglucosamine diphosphorylase / glucose-1-phosphate thymidylyltransferase / UDP-N-acetylgalactosamine diphosphorylase / glucosamine-1-phosphate N-acetyltransferase / galactosamine-1-phosphate N-acetyltransferase